MTKPTSLPLADGTREDCNFYVDGSSYQDSVPYFTSICAFAASVYDVTLADFGTWNKGLKIHDPACSFSPEKRYCAKLYFGEQTISSDEGSEYPIRDGASPQCTEYDDVWPDRDCQDILQANDISLQEFFALNPAVEADCSGLWPAYRYCIAASTSDDNVPANASTPTTGISRPTATSPMQSGQPSDCNKWYEVKSGDSCGSLVSQNSISLEQFYQWNPAVSKDCSSGFWSGYSYCVGTSGTQTKPQVQSTNAPTTTAAVIMAPQPIQPNSATSGCTKYAIAQDGDYCDVSLLKL
jgi:hypothetical protein